MVHPSVATTQVAAKTPVPWDILPAIETAKWDPQPERAPCLPLVPASHPEEPSGESIAQHFLASDDENVVPIRFGPYNLIYWIPVCSILYCRCEHPASRGGDPGCNPSTCVPASEPAPAGLLPHQPTLPAATRGSPGQPEGEMDAGASRSADTSVPSSVPKRGQLGKLCLQSQPLPKRETPPPPCAFRGSPQLLGRGASLSPSVKTSRGKSVPDSWPLPLA